MLTCMLGISKSNFNAPTCNTEFECASNWNPAPVIAWSILNRLRICRVSRQTTRRLNVFYLATIHYFLASRVLDSIPTVDDRADGGDLIAVCASFIAAPKPFSHVIHCFLHT